MAQTQYMINTFQSSVAIQNQMEQEGYCYYFLIVQGEKAGYTGLKKDGNTLFLSKIYVKKEFRRQHIAAAGIAFMTDLCLSLIHI